MIMAGIGAFIFVVAVSVNTWRVKRIRTEPGEAILAKDGVYFKGTIHNWNGVTSILDYVDFDPINPRRLVFVLRESIVKISCNFNN